MALLNLTRNGTFNQKKSVSVASAPFDFNDLNLVDDHQLFVLPDNSIITDLFFVVIEAGVAASTYELGFEGGTGSEIQTSGALTSVGVDRVGADLETDTGKTIIFTPSVQQTQGKWIAILEYIEFNLVTGDLTKLVK